MNHLILVLLFCVSLYSPRAFTGVNSGGGGSFIIASDGTVTWGDDRIRPSSDSLNLGTPAEVSRFSERISSDLRRASELFATYGGERSFFESKIFGRKYRLLPTQEFNPLARRFCPNEFGQLELEPGEMEAPGGCTYGNNTFFNSDLFFAALRNDLVSESYSIVRAIVHEGLHGLYPLLDHSRWKDITTGLRTLLRIDRRQQTSTDDFYLSSQELSEIEILRHTMRDFEIGHGSLDMVVHPNGGGLTLSRNRYEREVVIGLGSRVIGNVELGRDVRIINSNIIANKFGIFRPRIEIQQGSHITNSDLFLDGTEDSHTVEIEKAKRSFGSKLIQKLPFIDGDLLATWIIGANSRLLNSKVSGCGSLETQDTVVDGVGIGLPDCFTVSHFAPRTKILGRLTGQNFETYLSNRQMNLGEGVSIKDTKISGFDKLEVGAGAGTSGVQLYLSDKWLYEVLLEFGADSNVKNLRKTSVRAAQSMFVKELHKLIFPASRSFDFAGEGLCKNDDHEVSLGGGLVAVDARVKVESLQQIRKHCRKKD